MRHVPKWLAGLLAMILALPGAAQDSREVSGTAFYLPRIALPPGAEIAVEARGFDDESLGLMRRPLAGAQVPLPFGLSVPAGVAADLRVAVFVDGVARWLSAPVEIAPGGEDVNLGEVMLRPHTPYGFASELLCGGQRLRLGFAGDRALLDTGRAVHELAQVPAASGARYQSADGGVVVWTKGDSARIELDGAALPACARVPPAAPEIWRARGNEPGWTLELRGDRLVLVTGYGAETTEARLDPPAIRDGAFVYDAPDAGLRLTVAERLCHDSMTGMPYPQTASVARMGAVLEGCGGQPLDLLTGAEWVVADIAGAGIIDASGVTLLVRPDGGISGRGGCNRYAGQLEIGGETLRIGPVAATLMACAEALMAQERRFFEALERVDGFDIDASGALLLRAQGDTVIVARR